ncbi:MAG: YwaF family protein [Clostridia bacterium]|nr:YwaF family protein [Clostridia bacterium]
MLKEFFGFGGYSRPAEGYMSWQHLTFVSSLMVVMIALAVWLGLRNRNKPFKDQNKVMIVAAIAIDLAELFKIVIFCVRGNDPLGWLYELPLFLCSIQLITVPLAAFAKGRVREASQDFVCIFGVLGAVLGTYAAGQNYGCYPVLSFDNVVSGVTHCISGFAALYLMIAKIATMKKANIGLTFGVLTFFCVAAYTANVLLDYNYMFLMRGDGTPYDLVFSLVGGSPVWYPISVVVLFLVYIVAFYGVVFALRRPRRK